MPIPANLDELPDDLKVPPGFIRAPLEKQLQTAREDLHRWIQTQQPRVDRRHGGISMNYYAAGVQIRKSIIFSLLQLMQEP